jgi:hypothetical protein
MTALSADRDTPARDGKIFSYPILTATEIFAGSLIVLDSSGWAKPGVTGTGLVAVGRAKAYVNNTGASGALNVEVEAGVFRWVNGDTITKAHIGDTAYITDDQTVAKLGTGKSPCGFIVDVDSLGVWVQTDPALALTSVGLLAANNLSDVGSAATAVANLGLQDGSHSLQVNDLTVDDDLTVTDDLIVTGLATVGETLDVTGRITGLQKLVAGGAAYTVGSAVDGDAVITTATDNAVITLPDAAAGNAGKRITVINTGAAGAAKVSISPHSSDKIYGGIHGAAGGDLVTFAEGADKDIINTKATALKGDYAVLVSDGTSGWYVIGGKGVWASEP